AAPFFPASAPHAPSTSSRPPPLLSETQIHIAPSPLTPPPPLPALRSTAATPAANLPCARRSHPLPAHRSPIPFPRAAPPSPLRDGRWSWMARRSSGARGGVRRGRATAGWPAGGSRKAAAARAVPAGVKERTPSGWSQRQGQVPLLPLRRATLLLVAVLVGFLAYTARADLVISWADRRVDLTSHIVRVVKVCCLSCASRPRIYKRTP
ncbi:unnamed protein product, partial [Urochloa humidicola]